MTDHLTSSDSVSSVSSDCDSDMDQEKMKEILAEESLKLGTKTRTGRSRPGLSSPARSNWKCFIHYFVELFVELLMPSAHRDLAKYLLTTVRFV